MRIKMANDQYLEGTPLEFAIQAMASDCLNKLLSGELNLNQAQIQWDFLKATFELTKEK